jgi:hypothetical protein
MLILYILYLLKTFNKQRNETKNKRTECSIKILNRIRLIVYVSWLCCVSLYLPEYNLRRMRSTKYKKMRVMVLCNPSVRRKVCGRARGRRTVLSEMQSPETENSIRGSVLLLSNLWF